MSLLRPQGPGRRRHGRHARVLDRARVTLLKVSSTLSDDPTLPLFEPLALATHDVSRAGVEAGDKVLVFGGGPPELSLPWSPASKGPTSVAEITRFRLDILTALRLRTIGPDQDAVKFSDEWTGGGRGGHRLRGHRASVGREGGHGRRARVGYCQYRCHPRRAHAGESLPDVCPLPLDARQPALCASRLGGGHPARRSGAVPWGRWSVSVSR